MEKGRQFKIQRLKESSETALASSKIKHNLTILRTKNKCLLSVKSCLEKPNLATNKQEHVLGAKKLRKA